MKTRFVFSSFCMLVAMTMATGAFAQATFQVSAGAMQGRMNGHTEEAGGITLAVTSGMISDAETGTVLIDYGVPITNAVGAAPLTASGVTPPDNNISVSICRENDERETTATNAAVEGNTITITVAEDNVCGETASINIEGVQLSLVGSGRDNITASVTGTGDVRLLGGANTVTVMNSIVDELDDDGVDVDTTLTLIRHTGDPEDEKVTKFKLLIEENTVRSFDGAQINLEFSGIPAGVEITIDAWAATAEDLAGDGDLGDEFMVDQTLTDVDNTGEPPVLDDRMNAQLSINKVGTLEAVITAEDNKASVLTEQLLVMDVPDDDQSDAIDVNEMHTGGMLTSGVDVIIVLGSIDLGDEDAVDALLPLSLDIQVTADVGPVGVAKPKGDQSDSIPRFATDKTTAVTVIESTSAQTSLKVAYVLSEGLFDTGIAVSNMTKEEAGAVHFAFFTNGQELKYSTPNMLGPLSTMRILLSQLLASAEHTGSFSGYMTITADFNNADAGVFISDFTGFTTAVAVTPN